MVLDWTLFVVLVILVLGGLFSILVVFSLSRAATGGDADWQIARVDRKLDLILTHLGIGHDEHVPDEVVDLVRLGRTVEAVEEYRRLTGARAAVARREIEYLASRGASPQGAAGGEA